MASKRYVRFYLPCEEQSEEYDKLGYWNGTGYDIFTEKPTSIKEVEKNVRARVFGVEDVESELRQSIAMAKMKHDDNVQRGRLLLSLINEDGTPEYILSSVDRLAIRAYRNSIKGKDRSTVKDEKETQV